MNSLTTEATGIASLLPLETICPVLRLRTVIVVSAAAGAAAAVSCLARASRPAKLAAGSSGGASGSGALVPIGAMTVSCGPAGSGGVPYTLASQPATKGTAMMTAAVAVTNFGGRRRMTLPLCIADPESGLPRRPCRWLQTSGWVPTSRASGSCAFPASSGSDFSGLGPSGTIEQLSAGAGSRPLQDTQIHPIDRLGDASPRPTASSRRQQGSVTDEHAGLCGSTR